MHNNEAPFRFNEKHSNILIHWLQSVTAFDKLSSSVGLSTWLVVLNQ